MNKSYILILLVVLAAGCIEGLPFFGSDIVSVQKSVLEDKTKDILIMRDVFLDQGTNLIPDLAVRLEFLVENQDNQRSARNVYVDLFSAALFKPNLSVDPSGKIFCDSSTRPCVPDKCTFGNRCNILPLDSEQIMFSIRTPTQDDIGSIAQETTLDYRTFYDFEGSMTYSLPVVNIEEIRKRRRADETTTVVEAKSFGSGPVKVDVDLQGPAYMLADQKAIIFFIVQDKGSGNLKNTKIEVTNNPAAPPDQLKGLVITFPQDFNVTGNEYFDCQPAAQGTVCHNIKDIEMYKDESRVSLRFEVALRQDVLMAFNAQEIPFRYYQIKTRVGYTYELRDSTSVKINPYQNV